MSGQRKVFVCPDCNGLAEWREDVKAFCCTGNHEWTRRTNIERQTAVLIPERFRLDQLVGMKEVARSLPALVERLVKDGPFVVTRRSRPVAVLASISLRETVKSERSEADQRKAVG